MVDASYGGSKMARVPVPKIHINGKNYHYSGKKH
jgi:hypothetical protein